MFYPQGVVFGSLEYQFLSVQHEPEPAARSPPAYLTSNILLRIQQDLK